MPMPIAFLPRLIAVLPYPHNRLPITLHPYPYMRLPIALLPYPHNRQPITLHPYPYVRLPIAFLPYPRKPNRARTVVHGTGVPHLAVADSLCAVVHGTVVPHLAVADSLCGVVQVWDPCPMYNCTKAINYPMADNMSHLAISSGIAFILVCHDIRLLVCCIPCHTAHVTEAGALTTNSC